VRRTRKLPGLTVAELLAINSGLCQQLQCLRELRREAAQIGGDAVIAVDLDYSEFSGCGKSILKRSVAQSLKQVA
jgi:hypothetical protein